MEVRLLGGSWHSKKIMHDCRNSTIHLTKFIKKNRRLRWTPDLINLDAAFTVEYEIYEMKKMRKVTPIDDYRWLAEVRIAFVKKGSKIKDETFWKLAMYADSYEEMKWLGKA